MAINIHVYISIHVCIYTCVFTSKFQSSTTFQQPQATSKVGRRYRVSTLRVHVPI